MINSYFNTFCSSNQSETPMNLITVPKATEPKMGRVQWSPFPPFTLLVPPNKNKDDTTDLRGLDPPFSGHGACGACILGPAAAEQLGKEPGFGYGAYGETERSSFSRVGQATPTTKQSNFGEPKRSGHGFLIPLKIEVFFDIHIFEATSLIPELRGFSCD